MTVVDDVNRAIAGRLDEVATVLAEQGANLFRVRAYRRAAAVLRGLARPVTDILRDEGLDGLTALPGIGDSLGRSIRALADTGRLPMLERLRGEADPVALLASVPGIGPITADRLHHDLHLDSLEDLESAAHDGRLASAGFGAKRLAAVRDTLAQRLGRVRPHAAAHAAPPVEELLDVDREYRARGAAGDLPTIAPRRLNPAGEAWLPILHTTRGPRHYTALFSNTPRAHARRATHDWVVIYVDGDGSDSQATVVTARAGPLAGRRTVRGREVECLALSQGRAVGE